MARRQKRSIALAAGLLCGIVALILFLYSAAPEDSHTPRAVVSAIRTNGGAVVTVLVPGPYEVALATIYPIGQVPQTAQYPSMYLNSNSKRIGLPWVLNLEGDPRRPHRLNLYMVSPNRGFQDIKGRIRNCLRSKNPVNLLRRSHGVVSDLTSETILFSEAEPNDSANLVTPVKRQQSMGR